MATLKSGKRKELRDSAFAYIDSSGRRRLPIHDEPHVRNALARFSQVVFDTDQARDLARSRLLRAAKKYGIVPVGFIDGQFRATGPRSLPTGAVTFLLTDIQDSTGLVHSLGDRWAAVLAESRRLVRTEVRRAGGREVDARGDEFFAVFKRAASAGEAAVAIQRAIHAHPWPDGFSIKVRAGLHSGRPTLTDTGYVGLAVHATNRICSAGSGGQIVISRAALRAMADELPAGVSVVDLGTHRLRGIPDTEQLYELSIDELDRALPDGARA
jgi:class 3 adenylate cyclase